MDRKSEEKGRENRGERENKKEGKSDLVTRHE